MKSLHFTSLSFYVLWASILIGSILGSTVRAKAQDKSSAGTTERTTSYHIDAEGHTDFSGQIGTVCPTSLGIGTQNILRFQVTTTSTDPIPYTAVISVSPETIAITSTSANRGATWSTSGGTASLVGGTAVAGDTLKLEVVLLMIKPGTGTRSIVTTINGRESTNEQCTFPIPGPDVQLRKLVSTESPAVGSVYSYALDVFNPGPVSVPGITISDSLSPMVEFVAVSQGCTTEGPKITCTADSLSSGQVSRNLISVKALAEGSISNTATVVTEYPDPNESNNTSTITVEVVPQRMVLIMAASGDTLIVGDTLDYAISVFMISGTSTGMVIQDDLPDAVAYDGYTASGGVGCTYQPLDHQVKCSAGGLVIDVGDTLNVQIQTRAVSPGVAINRAIVFDDNNQGWVIDDTISEIFQRDQRLVVSSLSVMGFDLDPLGVDIMVSPPDRLGRSNGTTLSEDPFIFERIYGTGTQVSLVAPMIVGNLRFSHWGDLLKTYPPDPSLPLNQLRLTINEETYARATYVPAEPVDISFLVNLDTMDTVIDVGDTMQGRVQVKNNDNAATAYAVDWNMSLNNPLRFEGLSLSLGPCVTNNDTTVVGSAVTDCACASDDTGPDQVRCLIPQLYPGQSQEFFFLLSALETGTGTIKAWVDHSGTDPRPENNQDSTLFDIFFRTTDADLGVTLRSFYPGTDPNISTIVPFVGLGEAVSIRLTVTHHVGQPVDDVIIHTRIEGVSPDLIVNSQLFFSDGGDSTCFLPTGELLKDDRTIICEIAHMEEGESQSFDFTIQQYNERIPAQIPDDEFALFIQAGIVSPMDRVAPDEPDQAETSVALLRESMSTSTQFILLNNACADGNICMLRGDVDRDGTIDEQDITLWEFGGAVPDATTFLGASVGIHAGLNQFLLTDMNGDVVLDEEVDLGQGTNTTVIGNGGMMVLKHEEIPLRPDQKRVTFWYEGSLEFDPVLSIDVLGEGDRFIKRIPNFMPGSIRSVGIPFDQFNVQRNPNVRVRGLGSEEVYRMIPLGDCVWLIQILEDDLATTKALQQALQVSLFDAFGNRFESPVVTAIETEEERPSEYVLYPNYPNPFNPSTQIEYQVPRAGFVRLTVYNLYGQRVQTLVATEQAAGRYIARWDGTSQQGVSVASGVYFYRLESGNYTQSRKMILIK